MRPSGVSRVQALSQAVTERGVDMRQTGEMACAPRARVARAEMYLMAIVEGCDWRGGRLCACRIRLTMMMMLLETALIRRGLLYMFFVDVAWSTQ
jgi:hypothetical protein